MSGSEPNSGKILLLHPGAEGEPLADEAFGDEIVFRVKISEPARATEIIREGQCDVIILDLTVAHGPWRDMFRDLRKSAGRTPIVVLFDPERHSALELLGLGADALLPRSAGPAESVAVVESLLRRAAASDTLTRLDADIVIDFNQRTLKRGERFTRLAPRECDVLRHLVGSRGRVVSRSELAERLFGSEHASKHRALDVVISRLRAKLESDLGAVDIIRTAHGVGYVLGSAEHGTDDAEPAHGVRDDIDASRDETDLATSRAD